VSGVLDVDRDGSVLRITLARPDKRNALSPELIDALTTAFAGARDARAVVLRGAGPSFCAGADLEWMRASVDLTPEENVADARRLDALMTAVDRCPAPVVAGVQGHAIGGGCGLLACSDVVVAAPDAMFSLGEVKLGLVPAVISPYVLARVGTGAARHLFVTGERFDAAEALRIGLVHRLADDLDAAVEAVVADLLEAGPEAARLAKRLARGGISAEESVQLLAALRAGAEAQEGLRAFLQRRRPSWGGGD
jgi:enoyl-CoA hydratase/carnithine racemase